MRLTWVVVLVVFASRGTYAGPDDDTAKAETLFQEARALQKQGQDQEACAKFREALHYDRNALGAMLNVAQCDEKAGRVASAKKLFADARDRAREQQQGEGDSPLLRAAGDHIAQLEQQIPYIALTFSEPPTAETKLLINGDIIPIDSAANIPVDPGTVTIVVSQPDRVQYEQKIEIQPAQHKAFNIPKLAHPVVERQSRRLGKIIAISGVGVAAASVVFGAVAKYEYGLAYTDGNCAKADNKLQCTKPNTTNSWVERGNLGTAVGIFGLVAVGVGGYLWWSGTRVEHFAFLPDIAPDHAGLLATGRF